MARTLIVSDKNNSFFTANNIKVGNRIPVKGDYVKGDIIVNIGENTANEAMWICTESGNPGTWEVVGAGVGSGGGSSCSFVSINDSVFVNEPVNEVSLQGLGSVISSKDKLIVHLNSTHLMEGVDYEINSDGTKIIKLGEGNWNESGEDGNLFAFELFKHVKNVDGDKIVVDSRLTTITNHVVISNRVNEVEIGIDVFKKDNDMLMVFKNSVFMVEGVDYEINEAGTKIISTGDIWNEEGIEDYSVTFVVFKEVVDYNALEGNLDDYQLRIDNELITENKTVIGAINELFTNANNGKELIADAIGEPLDPSDTFSAMSNDIKGLLSTFKSNMMNNGVNVEADDKFKQLIDKIALLSQSGGNMNFAEGDIDDFSMNGETYNHEFTFTNELPFIPTLFFVKFNRIHDNTGSTITNIVLSNKTSGQVLLGYNYLHFGIEVDQNTMILSFESNHNSYVSFEGIHFYAIGVGEEDTALRDSLASILEEEGVEVLEEDTMADLIVKVDEEFDRKNANVIMKVEGTTTYNEMMNGGVYLGFRPTDVYLKIPDPDQASGLGHQEFYYTHNVFSNEKKLYAYEDIADQPFVENFAWNEVQCTLTVTSTGFARISGWGTTDITSEVKYIAYKFF